jgi:hypothetical protein
LLGVDAAVPTSSGASQKTVMGLAAPFGEAPLSAAAAAATGQTQVSGTPSRASAALGYDPLTDPDRAAATVVDVPSFALADVPGLAAPPSGATGSHRTLLGVARPGIAPLKPGIAKSSPEPQADPPGYAPMQELGATQHLPDLRARFAAQDKKIPPPAPSSNAGKHPLGQRRFDKAPKLEDKVGRRVRKAASKSSRRGLYVVLAGVVLAAAAVVVALIWPNPPPLRAQVRAADGGAEVLDVTCESCPNGTVLSLRDEQATVQGGRATLPLSAPLAIGDTSLRVSVDRPDRGRDETVTLPVRVAYRVRPDLTTLDADRPSIQVVVEAMEGSRVSLDGEDVPLREGRAIKSIEVSKDLMGTNGDAGAQLARKVSFIVEPPDGAEEKGVVAVSVPVLPLTIDAPGRAVVTDKPTFQLAGRTLPGAEIVVAGRSIGVAKDGAFSQTMNVSSVGATQIEVRARMLGRAPRLARLGVERVSSLETAAQEFVKKGAVTYDTVSRDVAAAVGQLAAIEGEVLEVKAQPPVTVMIVSATSAACPDGDASTRRCLVRLVQGRSDLEVERGAKIRAFGVVTGTIAHEGQRVPDLDVAFSLPTKRP